MPAELAVDAPFNLAEPTGEDQAETMPEQPQNSNSDEAARQAQGKRPVWSTALFWGLLLGAIVSFGAGLRRWLHTGGRAAPLRSTRPPSEHALEGMAGRDIEPLPGAVTAAPPTSTAAAATVASGAALPQSQGISSSEPVAESRKPPHRSHAPVPATQKMSPSAAVQPIRWKEPTKYIVGVGLFLAILFIIYISRSVLPTIILGALLALIVHPIVRLFRKRLKLSKGLSVGIIYLLIIVLLVLIPLIVVPALINSINNVLSIDFQSLSQDVSQALQDLSATVAGIPVLNRLLGPLLDSLVAATESISSVPPPEPISYDATMGSLVEQLASALGVIVSIVGPVVSAIISLAFMLLISLYLSLSGDSIMEAYPRLFPPAIDVEIINLVQRIQGVWVSFLRGQLTLMIFIGTVIFLGNAVLGNQNALLLGIISGTLEIIPNIGPALALIPGVLMALIFGSSHFAISNVAFAIIVLAYYLLVQVFENQVVVPYLLGGAVDLPPLVVILGVMVGGTVAGILGVLLATPIIASGREVFGYLYNKILEPPVAEGPPKEKRSLTDAIRERARRLRLPIGRREHPPSTTEEQKLSAP
jgi:predicted PurR-regulated permease PerM